jgi:hypothetical protein
MYSQQPEFLGVFPFTDHRRILDTARGAHVPKYSLVLSVLCLQDPPGDLEVPALVEVDSTAAASAYTRHNYSLFRIINSFFEVLRVERRDHALALALHIFDHLLLDFLCLVLRSGKLRCLLGAVRRVSIVIDDKGAWSFSISAASSAARLIRSPSTKSGISEYLAFLDLPVSPPASSCSRMPLALRFSPTV